MSKPDAGTVEPTRWHNGAYAPATNEGKPDAQTLRRREIVQYIRDMLGPDLASAALPHQPSMTYGQAAEQSVSTGCYDHSWSQHEFDRVDAYIASLKEIWIRSQGDVSHMVARLQHLLAFGTDSEKAQLKKLLGLQ